MNFARIETSVRTNKKFLAAGPAPSWLWVCGLLYCQDGLTDGFIPEAAIDYLGVRGARRLVPHLVKVQLWEPVDGGYQVHDYLEHNRSAAEVGALRGARQAAGSQGGLTTAQALRDLRAKATASAAANAVVPAAPSTYTGTETSTETEGRSAPARPGAPLVDQREHRKHAHCGRVCLHAALFGEFVRRRNHPGADREIRDWCAEIEARWSRSDEEPGDSFDFWRARYEEQWPAAKTVKPTFGTWKPKGVS